MDGLTDLMINNLFYFIEQAKKDVAGKPSSSSGGKKAKKAS